MKDQVIHLWQGDIVGDETKYPNFWDILDQNEQQHAQAISNRNLRLNYVETHARLRILLADVVNAKPEQLCILRTEQGKPYLADYPELAFNLSHTANKFVVAYAYDHELGVDIEACKPRANLAALVEKCLAEEEQKYWLQLPELQQTEAFYRFWTRKEAFVKAVGRGIALGLNQCVVDPENQNQFLRIPKGYGQTGDWLIQEIIMAAPFCGAIAAKKHSLQ